MDPSLHGGGYSVPTRQQHSGISRSMLLIIIGVVLAIVMGTVLLITSGDNTGNLRQQYSAREERVLDIVTDGRKNIADSDLAKVNSDLYLVLLSDSTTTASALRDAGLDKISKDITSAESSSSVLEELKDARSTGQYDSTYRSVIIEELSSLSSLAQELHDKTSSRSLKAALSDEYTHVVSYKKDFESL